MIDDEADNGKRHDGFGEGRQQKLPGRHHQGAGFHDEGQMEVLEIRGA